MDLGTYREPFPLLGQRMPKLLIGKAGSATFTLARSLSFHSKLLRPQ